MLTLQQVGVGALDLVYEPLAPRVLRHARTLGLGDVSVDLEEPAMASVLATAELIHGVLSRARAGTGLDLVRPQDRGGVVIGPPPAGGIGSEAGPLETTLPDVDRGNRRARLDGARARLQSAVARLAGIDVTAPPPAESSLVEALDTLAAFGVAPGGDPAQAPSATALLALHDAGQARLAASEASPDDPAALFGEGFPVLSLAAPPFAAPLTAALGSDPLAAAPADVLAPLGGAGAALVSWLETHGRVRPGVGRLADLLLAARLRGTQGPAGLRAVQLPVEPFPGADPARRRQWVGLPFPAALGPDPVTSLVVHALGDIDPTEGTAVLVVDEFVEVVPAAETTTAVSFGFDAPGARPPQSILLAVPPVADAPWTIDALAEVIGETLDLAKIRMVDLSAVAWAGRFVPTIYLTDGDVASGLDLPMRDLVKQAHLHAEVFRP
jgi:hypothetical protein